MSNKKKDVKVSEPDNRTWFQKFRSITISGIELPMFLIITVLVVVAAIIGTLPGSAMSQDGTVSTGIMNDLIAHGLSNETIQKIIVLSEQTNMVGALAIMMVLGNLFYFLGTKIPIVRSYLGGGAVFCIFATAVIAELGIIPEFTIDNCDIFMNEVGFLDFYIAALITGSILGMNRKMLIKSSVRFLPVAFASMAIAILVSGSVGMLLGNGFLDTILYIALPMMSGGMGAGVTPLSKIYSGALSVDQQAVFTQMVPASALGNVFAIIVAALIVKIFANNAKLNGHGKLMKIDEKDEEKKSAAKINVESMGAGLLMALTFYILGIYINKLFPNIHAYAFMIILVVLVKILGIIPEKYEQSAVLWSNFVMKSLTNALLAGIGLTLLDLQAIAAIISPQYIIIILSTIIVVALCAGFGGKLVGFYSVESSITAGLCTNSMGGTGNIAVLSASERMELIPFAQMATRIGGALVLIVSSLLVQVVK